VWQDFYRKHSGPDFELLSIAVDLQGASVVEPYARKFGVTFPVAVDTADVVGRAFGLKAIPVTFLVDEVGIVRLRGGGPTPEFLRQIEAVLGEPLSRSRGTLPQLPSARSRKELERRVARAPDDWEARLALARLYDVEGRGFAAIAQLREAERLRPRASGIPFLWGLVLLHQDDKQNALAKFKVARDLEPDNWRIRKQIWAIENPDKFYTGDSPDFGWQKEELAREKAGRNAR
jgi:tetratricopeptide (TPR) repeat protein